VLLSHSRSHRRPLSFRNERNVIEGMLSQNCRSRCSFLSRNEFRLREVNQQLRNCISGHGFAEAKGSVKACKPPGRALSAS